MLRQRREVVTRGALRIRTSSTASRPMPVLPQSRKGDSDFFPFHLGGQRARRYEVLERGACRLGSDGVATQSL